MEENFLLLFRFDNPLESSVEFMKVSDNQEFLTLKFHKINLSAIKLDLA